MATTTISGSTVRVNTGIVLAGGTTSTNINRLSVLDSANNHNLTDCKPNISRFSGVQFLMKNAGTAITTITQSASTGFCAVTKSSHGFSVGDKFVVEGCDISAYNTIHQVVVVTSSSVVKTNVVYTSDSTTHGTYYVISGNFAKQTINKYVGKIICTELAGVSNTVLKSGAGDFGAYPSAPSRGSRRYDITSINLFNGSVTRGGSEGTLNKYHNISANNDNTTVESFSTKAVPGRLTYRTGKSIPVSGNYAANT